jgi:hypothetical protein
VFCCDLFAVDDPFRVERAIDCPRVDDDLPGGHPNACSHSADRLRRAGRYAVDF